MTDGGPCRPQTLAQHGAIRIDLCGCGQLHVTIGPLTLRLGRGDYLALCDTLLAATQRLPQGDGQALH